MAVIKVDFHYTDLDLAQNDRYTKLLYVMKLGAQNERKQLPPTLPGSKSTEIAHTSIAGHVDLDTRVYYTLQYLHNSTYTCTATRVPDKKRIFMSIMPIS